MTLHGGAGAEWPSLHSRRRERRIAAGENVEPNESRYEEAPGFRHFIRWPESTERYTVGGQAFNPADKQQLARAEDLMTKLADAVSATLPPKGEKDGLTNELNLGLPAGYTYFLQLLSHDLVHSSLALSRSEAQTAGFANLRRMPLRLETIYGGGPTQCPIAFERDASGPRTRMRVGVARGDTSGRQRDIGRGRAAGQSCSAGYPDALIADPRNDMHPILSQLTNLFHHLHNAIADRLEKDAGLPEYKNGFARAHLVFLLSQCACVLIYRTLIREDLFGRILHPDVRSAYASGKGPLLDTDNGVSRGDWSAPLEFTHGVLRFGHAMVRRAYVFNKGNNFNIRQALTINSELQREKMPIPNRWTIDWPFFFDSKVGATNSSIRIGAWSNEFLDDAVKNEPPQSGGTLLLRDFVSSIMPQPWSLRALLREIRTRRPNLLIGSQLLSDNGEGGWVQPISEWLEQTVAKVNSPPTEADIKEIANDPPIAFFTRFEAGNAPGADGTHLGVFGSIMMADVVCAILRQDDLLEITPFADLAIQLQELESKLGVKAGSLAFLSGLRSFASVLEFLHDRIAFPEPKPA